MYTPPLFSGNDDKGSDILRMHFAVKGFLDCHIVNQNKITHLKVKIAYGRYVIPFKPDSSLKPSQHDMQMQHREM